MAEFAALFKIAFSTAKEVATVAEAATVSAPAAAPAEEPQAAIPIPTPIYKPSRPIGLTIAILTGAFFKLYDDFNDLHLLPDDHLVMEFFKVGITVFTTLLLVQDVYITLVFLLLSIMELALKSADTPYWRAGIIIPIVCLLLHIPHFVMPSMLYIGIFAAINVLMLFVGYIEKYAFPEETSSNKLINRALVLGAGIVMLYNAGKYGDHAYIPLMGGWAVGYMAIYVITHGYELYKQAQISKSADYTM
jgi:hypothetical protein